MTSAPSKVLRLFLAAAERAEEVIGSEAVAARWDEPSALEGYTVAGLAGHLARGILTVEKYIDTTADETAEVTDAAGYTVAVLAAHDPVESDFHRAVRARGLETAADGPAAVVRMVGETRKRLSFRLNGDVMGQRQRIEVLHGVVVTVGEYLRTRLVELVVHLDDLAISIGEDHGCKLTEETYEEAAVLLAQVAVRRDGGLEVVRGLARRERHPDAIRAL